MNENERNKREIINPSTVGQESIKLDSINIKNQTEFQTAKNNSSYRNHTIRFKKRAYNQETKNRYPHFHVTYWMFYPYSQVSSFLEKVYTKDNELVFKLKSS